MPRNFFITGAPKSGKTTLLKEIVTELRKSGLKVGGFVSPEERHHGTRTAFRVMDVQSGKMAELANVKGDGPKVSKYHVDVRSFESIAVPAMESFDDCDVFVIDEIGVMEMKSVKFARLLDRIIESDTPLIAALHGQFVDKFGSSGEILELDQDSRGEVFERLLEEARGSITKKAPKPAKKPEATKAAEKETAPQKKAKGKAKKEAKKAPAKEKKAAPPKEKPAAEKKEEAEKKGEEKKEAEQPKGEEKHEERHHAEKKEEPKKGGILGSLKRLFGG